MEWQWNVSTETIWTSFDYGTVEADTQEEALEKAVAQVTTDLNECNKILKGTGFNIGISTDQIQIERVKKI